MFLPSLFHLKGLIERGFDSLVPFSALLEGLAGRCSGISDFRSLFLLKGLRDRGLEAEFLLEGLLGRDDDSSFLEANKILLKGLTGRGFGISFREALFDGLSGRGFFFSFTFDFS